MAPIQDGGRGKSIMADKNTEIFQNRYRKHKKGVQKYDMTDIFTKYKYQRTIYRKK